MRRLVVEASTDEKEDLGVRDSIVPAPVLFRNEILEGYYFVRRAKRRSFSSALQAQQSAYDAFSGAPQLFEAFYLFVTSANF